MPPKWQAAQYHTYKNCQQHRRGSSNIWARKSQVDSSPCHNNTSLRTLGSCSEGWDDWACPQRTRTKPDSVTYYSDSKFILGYITNESRRFYVYVSNRVERIRRSSAPHQWKVRCRTNLNPADLATWSIEASRESTREAHRTGPKFLYNSPLQLQPDDSSASKRTGL